MIDSVWLMLGELARRLDESPRRITDLLYRHSHRYPTGLTRVVEGRRLVHVDLIPLLKQELLRRPGRPKSVPANSTAACEPAAALS